MIYLSIGSCDDERASQSLIAKNLLSALLCSLGFKQTEIIKDRNGRPYLPSGYPDISISHSGNICAVGVICDVDAKEGFSFSIPVIGTRIGIDIERFPTDFDIEKHKRIAGRFLDTDISSPEEFFRLWTRKEAYGKMAGEGFFTKEQIPCNIYTFVLDHNNEKYCLSIAVK